MFLSTILVSLLLIGVSCNDHSLQMIQWRLTNIEEKQFKDAQMFNNSLNDIKQYMDDKMRCCTEQSTSDEKTYNNNMDTIVNNSVINDVIHQVSVIKRAFADQKQFVKHKFENSNLVNEQILDAKIVECRENIFGSIDKRFNEHDSDIKKKFSGIVERNKELETSVNIFKEESRVTQIENQKKQDDLSRQIMNLRTQNKQLESSVNNCQNDLSDLRDFQNNNLKKQNDNKEQITAIRNTIRTLFSIQSSGSAVFCHLGSCYIFGHGATWLESKQRCKTLGGALAVVNNDDENTYLVSLLKNLDTSKYGYGVFLGASDLEKEGTWTWESNGRNINELYSNFKGSEPNGGKRENCLHLYAHYFWAWNDTNCNLKMGYVCEFINPLN